MNEGQEMVGGANDENALESILDSLRESLNALNIRREQVAGTPGETAVIAQISDIERRIREAEAQLG